MLMKGLDSNITESDCKALDAAMTNGCPVTIKPLQNGLKF